MKKHLKYLRYLADVDDLPSGSEISGIKGEAEEPKSSVVLLPFS